jgi:hypothetical protein
VLSAVELDIQRIGQKERSLEIHIL